MTKLLAYAFRSLATALAMSYSSINGQHDVQKRQFHGTQATRHGSGGQAATVTSRQ